MKLNFPPLPDILVELPTPGLCRDKAQCISFISTKNRSELLEVTLPAIAAECEAVYVVDSSTDRKTRDLCAQYADFGRVRYHGIDEQRAAFEQFQVLRRAHAAGYIEPFTSDRRDIPIKRNYILLLAALYGYSHLLFLDDDIFVPSGLISSVLKLSRTYSLVGANIAGMPDLSVVDHISVLFGVNRPSFLSSNFLAANVKQVGQFFFPDIYNSDWFFIFINAMVSPIARAGEVFQVYWNPYVGTQRRAAYEEYGEIMIEGLMQAISTNRNMILLEQRAHWEQVIARRRQNLAELALSASARSIPKVSSILAETQNRASSIGAIECVEFWRCYCSRLDEWRALIKEAESQEISVK